MSYQVQIKFMNFQRRYLVRILQLLSFNVLVILFQPLRLLPFTFPYAFQLEQGDQRSPSQTSAGQYSSEKIQLLSRRLLDLICVGGTLFSFELGAENHQVHDHRQMMLIVVDNGNQEACHSRGKVGESPLQPSPPLPIKNVPSLI